MNELTSDKQRKKYNSGATNKRRRHSCAITLDYRASDEVRDRSVHAQLNAIYFLNGVFVVIIGRHALSLCDRRQLNAHGEIATGHGSGHQAGHTGAVRSYTTAVSGRSCLYNLRLSVPEAYIGHSRNLG